MRNFNRVVLPFLLCLALYAMNLSHAIAENVTVLDVGVELLEETLPLKIGHRLYQIRRLRPSAWYEVKISYPASIPASFSIELRRSPLPESLSRKNRRLLNTEKVVFKADMDESFVLVTVAAAGVVAKRNVQERDLIIFNIVCDELFLGIPLGAWSVGILAIMCVVLALMAAVFLPFNLFTGDRMDDPNKLASSKAS
ncbi:uncharacterized protein LOC144712852 [Wolffia australiana]